MARTKPELQALVHCFVDSFTRQVTPLLFSTLRATYGSDFSNHLHVQEEFGEIKGSFLCPYRSILENWDITEPIFLERPNGLKRAVERLSEIQQDIQKSTTRSGSNLEKDCLALIAVATALKSGPEAILLLNDAAKEARKL